MKITGQEMDFILEFLESNYNLTYSATKKFPKITITAEMVEESDGDLEGLEGYTFQCVEKDGTHKHDGQDVGYTFEITSPSSDKVRFLTEMNLVAGWNVSGDIEI